MDPDLPDLSGRTIMITGANSGLGFETSRWLASRGARVWMLCRSQERCLGAQHRIVSDVPGADIETVLADFEDLSTVRDAAIRFLDGGERLDALVNNAGGIFGRRAVTRDGLERSWQVNLVAPFLLTGLLRERLADSGPARIVNVTSDAYKAASRIRWDDLAWEQRRYRGFAAYAHAKLGVQLWTRELARRLQGTGVVANTVHPGTVRTNFGASWGWPMSWLWILIEPLLRSPHKGARTIVWMAASDETAGVSGEHFFDLERQKQLPQARDDDAARRLWDVLADSVATHLP
jgi:NAD(P)-dependent dehydrogenase (short-subunit alcohol dehydrogenase family)